MEIMMEVTDLAGNSIKVEDLEAAINQADWFRNLLHDGPGFEKFDKRRHVYLEDIYQKIIGLK